MTRNSNLVGWQASIFFICFKRFMEQFKTDTGTTNKKEAYFCKRKEQSANNILGKS